MANRWETVESDKPVPLLWQVGSYPLRHQGSPRLWIFMTFQCRLESLKNSVDHFSETYQIPEPEEKPFSHT